MPPSNQQILEGLYTLGYPVDRLANVDKNLPTADFRRQLEAQGINAADFGKAERLVTYRGEEGRSKHSIQQMLDIMGASQTTKDRFAKVQITNVPEMHRVLVQELGEERAGALMIKATRGKPPEGTVWNPFRGDKPPPGVNVKWGAMGVITGVGSPAHQDLPVQRPTGAVGGPRAQPGAAAPAPGGAAPPSGIDSPILGGTPPGGGGTPTPTAVDTRPQWVKEGRDPTPEEFDQYVNDNFGAQAWFMDVPEVRQVIWDMAKGGLTDGAEAQRRVSKTSWFKNTSASARTWWAHERADPATAQRDIAEQTSTFKAMANKLGVEIPEDRLRTIAEASLRFGWNQAQINQAIGKEFRYDPSKKQQSAKVSEMKALAAKYLVPLADQTIDTWARGLMTGEFADEQFAEYLKGTAKSLFPQLSQAIDSGLTVEDYVNPYKQLAAQRLELPPEAINFTDPKWRAALQQPDPKTGQTRVMTLTEWEAHIKKDPTYGYDKTQQGVGEAAKLANDLLQKFGQVA